MGADGAEPRYKYHVLCDRGFVPRVLGWCALFFAVVTMTPLTALGREVFEVAKVHVMARAHSLGWWSVISLLASSCCAVQLALNLLSVGCAGLNTVLGPWRPMFIAFAATGQAVMWWAIELPAVQRRSAVASTALTVGMTLLPEMLYLWQRIKSREKSGAATESTMSPTVDLHLAIENMGCVACVTTISNTIRSVQGVRSCKISLETGEAWVSLLCPEEAPTNFASDTGRELCDKVCEVGFPTSVVSTTTAAPSAKTIVQPTTEPNGTDPAPLWRDLLHSVSAGLLSSSCCALQLGLNLLSAFDVVHIGCAGFNKFLGPVRGVLRALTISWLSWLWYRTQTSPTESATSGAKARRASLRNRLVVQTAVTVSLMFLPEALRIFGGPSVAPSTENAVELQFAVPGLGCEACETAATRIINRQSGVLWSSVDFEAGTAKIMVAKDWNFDTERLKARLEYAGYGLDDPSRATPQERHKVNSNNKDALAEGSKQENNAVVEEVLLPSEDDWID